MSLTLTLTLQILLWSILLAWGIKTIIHLCMSPRQNQTTQQSQGQIHFISKPVASYGHLWFQIWNNKNNVCKFIAYDIHTHKHSIICPIPYKWKIRRNNAIAYGQYLYIMLNNNGIMKFDTKSNTFRILHSRHLRIIKDPIGKYIHFNTGISYNLHTHQITNFSRRLDEFIRDQKNNKLYAIILPSNTTTKCPRIFPTNRLDQNIMNNCVTPYQLIKKDCFAYFPDTVNYHRLTCKFVVYDEFFICCETRLQDARLFLWVKSPGVKEAAVSLLINHSIEDARIFHSMVIIKHFNAMFYHIFSKLFVTDILIPDDIQRLIELFHGDYFEYKLHIFKSRVIQRHTIGSFHQQHPLGSIINEYLQNN